jgi:hypothetical protein
MLGCASYKKQSLILNFKDFAGCNTVGTWKNLRRSAPKCHGSLTLVLLVKKSCHFLQQPQQLPPAPFPQQQQQQQQAEPGKREEAAGPGRPDAVPVRQEAVRPAGYAAAAAGRFTTPMCQCFLGSAFI